MDATTFGSPARGAVWRTMPVTTDLSVRSEATQRPSCENRDDVHGKQISLASEKARLRVPEARFKSDTSRRSCFGSGVE